MVAVCIAQNALSNYMVVTHAQISTGALPAPTLAQNPVSNIASLQSHFMDLLLCARRIGGRGRCYGE